MPVAIPVVSETEITKMESSKLQFRQLEAEDYDRGYLECLSHLTTVGDISREQFNGIISLMVKVLIRWYRKTAVV